MHFKLGILCIVKVLLTVNGFEVFSINEGYKGLIEKLESRSIQPRADTIERWIEQKLDHFDETNTRTWKMRYYQDLQFWKPDGPIYLFISGEAPATASFLATGVVYELAKETQGAMYLSEHRYYGKSQPINRTQFHVEDMKFLSTEQALADNANLLETIKNNINFKNSKVVVVGGSYAGNLAAWMKLVYPDLVDAAIASSGPVLAKRDFYEYLEIVNRDYEKFGSSNCIENIRKVFKRYDTLLQTEDGMQQLKYEMNICQTTDMHKPENRQIFFLAMVLPFMSRAQYGTVEDIKKHCSEFDEVQDTLLVSNKKYYWRNDVNCYDFEFNLMVQEYHEPKNDDMLCWTYQTCNEFGYFQTGKGDKHPFTHNMVAEWYDNFCTYLFGAAFDKDRVNEGVRKINDVYGGRFPNVTEVVFVNGEMDPWSSLSVLEVGSIMAHVNYIPKSSHCRDLFSDEPGDEEELKEARARIRDQIKKWIGLGDDVEKKQNEN